MEASERQKYLDQVEARMGTWRADIHALRAKADGKDASAREEYATEVDGLEARLSDLEKELEAARESSEDAWDNVKNDLSAAFEAADQAFSQSKG
ncbi:hypothetical protein [Litorisediminicola beolgyonensis]|uniref:Coiled coil domain-containing protein n=1 Tax=Litorisediminicola beolgyonensis TaxID=1173614 RepID=A0ABW3ZJK6_9RHOB